MERAKWLGSTPTDFLVWGLISFFVTAVLVFGIWKVNKSPNPGDRDARWLCVIVLVCWWMLAFLRFYFRYRDFWNTGS